MAPHLPRTMRGRAGALDPLRLAVAAIVVGLSLSQAKSGDLLSRDEAGACLRRQVKPADVAWLRSATLRQLARCQAKANSGTVLFMPDGSGHYRALWTRDFAYMVCNAGDLMDRDPVRSAIVFLPLASQLRRICRSISAGNQVSVLKC